MSNAGRAGPIALATLVGALAGFAVSPLPVYFNAEWLAWVVVPVFAVAGCILGFLYTAAGSK
jgi:hypothetical protein